MQDWTIDRILNGRLEIAQPKSGYRFSIDALILAHHIMPTAGERIVDIGTGCGIIPLILACKSPESNLFGIEVQSELADLAESNAAANRLSDRIRIIRKDVRMVTPSETGPADIITCNPPHTAKTAGRINPANQMAVARHEILMTLNDLADAANRLLISKGRLFTIYPANRMADVLLELRGAGLEPKQIRTIHFKSDTPARRVLFQAIKGGQPGIEILSPLFIHRPGGSYTREAEAIINPGRRQPEKATD